MTEQQEIDYQRVASAIAYLKANYQQQPRLEVVAEHVHVSPYHFQRMFRRWAGVSPKQFLQYLSIDHAKRKLRETQATLLETAHESGLSGTGRLHDLFVTIEGMTPGEYKNGGEALSISYSFSGTPFGEVLVASTVKGICKMVFVEKERKEALDNLKHTFPNASYREEEEPLHREVLFVFNQDWEKPQPLRLHVKGTGFQLKVWEALLKIPHAGLATYADLAIRTGHQGAYRAVGTAVGANPVAYLIPCHRVIKSTGETGNYRWGEDRKKLLIGWEAARH